MNLPAKQKAAGMPAVFRQQDTPEVFEEFSGGVQSGFAIISFRGKVWRLRKSGKEDSYLDAEGGAIPSIEVVMVRGNKHPSKTFYAGKYEEGSTEAPTCWSSSGVKPDAEVQTPVSKTCAACPNNVWGSRITEQGTKSRLCADVRRVAVVFKSDLEDHGVEATPFLMRIPPASLNPLKDYANGLKTRSIYPHAIVTKVGFDSTVSHPKMTFRPVRLVDDEEGEAIMALRENEVVLQILAESAEFVAAGNTDDDGEVEPPHSEATSSAPVAASLGKKKKLKPIEEEEVASEEEEEEAEASPPPAVPPRPAARKKPMPSAAETSSGKESIDSMLDNLFGKKK